MTKPRVLLTGFPAFLDHTRNVSEEILRNIVKEGVSSVELEGLLLSVDQKGSLEVADRIRSGDTFDAIIHLGLAANRTLFSLERYAKNRLDMKDSDMSGRQISNQPILENSPDILQTSASIHILDEEFDAEDDVVWSLDAGGYVCNETFFRTLDALRTREIDIPAIFLHLPPETKMPISTQINYVRRIITCIACPPRMKVVGGLLRDDSGRILSARRPPSDAWGGWWEFPGGKVDEGETIAEALVREIDEELGIKVEAGEIIAKLEYDYGDRFVELMVIDCGIINQKIIPKEHDEIRWLSSDELDTVKWLPADLPLIEKWLKEGIPQSSS